MTILFPIPADKTAIKEFWKQSWLNLMARKGLDCLDYDKVSTKWLTYPMFSGCDYKDFVKLTSQTLPGKSQ